METKNTILARQKEMQLSLEKVKHLIRLIQAFNFNQTLAETEAKDISPRVQISAEGALSSEPAADSPSVEGAKAGGTSASQGSSPEEQHRAAGIKQSTQAALAGDAGGPAPAQDGVAPAAEQSRGSGPGDAAEPGGASTGTAAQAEMVAEAPPAGDAPVASALATTNGTTEAACPAHSPAGGGATSADKRLAAVASPETAAEKQQEEITDTDGSNNSNSKTSEPCQHSLPALVSSLDNKN